MDPNANLALQTELARRILSEDHNYVIDVEDTIELAELVLALDTWIKGETNGP